MSTPAMDVSVSPVAMMASAAVPAFKCPTGTKMYILNLGTLEADESWYAETWGFPLGFSSDALQALPRRQYEYFK